MSDRSFLTAEEQIAIMEAPRKSSTPVPNPSEIDAMIAEIERLRAALEEQNGGMAIIRSATIEECARVAASFHAFEVADAIRALKDKP